MAIRQGASAWEQESESQSDLIRKIEGAGRQGDRLDWFPSLDMTAVWEPF